jgi:hypothetical protein
MQTYERPALMSAGSFFGLTGCGITGPKDLLGGRQLL